jgi:phosphoribosylamine--glycine ligase
MPRLDSDLVGLFLAACDGTLAGASARWRDDTALTVVMAAKGYPGAVEKGTPIRGVEAAERADGVRIFHAGTKDDNGRLLANGGRVLNVTAIGRTVAQAQALAYETVGKIDWPEGFCRWDIGWRAVERERS